MSFTLVDAQPPLLQLTNIIALAIPPRYQFLRVALSFPIIVFLVPQSLNRKWSGIWGTHYGLNCYVWTTVLQWVDWVVLQSPDREGWRQVDRRVEGGGEQRKNPSSLREEQGFWRRIWWGVKLATTTRYVGWSCEVKNLPVEREYGSYPRLYVSLLTSFLFLFIYIYIYI
jgi:hypothetical protein